MENTVWAQLSPNGEIPSPRSTFAGCNAMGSGFMIFGGTGASIYNDLYYYDLNSNYWKNLIPSSLPSGRFASCMSIGKYLYLHGGITSTGVTDEVWVYDFYSNSFQLAINAGRIRLFVARHMCRLEESEESETFYVIGGESFYQLPNKVIYAVTIYQISGIFYYKILEVYKDFTGMIGRSDSSLVYTLNYTMQFFGTIYGFYATSFIAVINNFSQTAFPIFLPSTFYAQSVIHYKKDLYIYGGGFSMDTTTQIKSFSNNFYKLSLTESDYVSMDCSLGTIGAFCELCPKGTYATNLTYCEPCIAGKMSNNIGATTSQICLPCGYGSFSNIVGASYCKNCETNMICMIGTKTPVNQSSFGNEKSIQPRAFQAEKNPFSQNILYLLMGGFVAPIALGFLLFSQVREKVKKFDMYASQHQQKENEAIIMKKTSIGGLFSVFFLMLSLLLVISAVVAFSKDNVYETKGLVPIITITDEVFSESFSISAVFYNYGGLCAGDLNYNSRIFIEDSTLNYSSKAITCERTVNDCIVSIDYQKLSISFNPSVTFKLEEQGSFASYISLNTTSLSSIPGETSSILLFSYPNSPQEVFRGSIPTVFSLEATPSVCYI